MILYFGRWRDMFTCSFCEQPTAVLFSFSNECPLPVIPSALTLLAWSDSVLAFCCSTLLLKVGLPMVAVIRNTVRSQ
ncbi:hypothetical protein M513_12122, partial [Trichuris suis]